MILMWDPRGDTIIVKGEDRRREPVDPNGWTTGIFPASKEPRQSLRYARSPGQAPAARVSDPTPSQLHSWKGEVTVHSACCI